MNHNIYNFLRLFIIVSLLFSTVSTIYAQDNRSINFKKMSTIAPHYPPDDPVNPVVKSDVGYYWKTSSNTQFDAKRHLRISFKVAGSWIEYYSSDLADGNDYNGGGGYDPYATDVKVEWSGHHEMYPVGLPGMMWEPEADWDKTETRHLEGYPNNNPVSIVAWTKYTARITMDRTEGVDITLKD